MEQEGLPSFRLFDYRVRTNKSTERRMLNEAFRRLSFFDPTENYRYVGFGSTTFADFVLFHRTLNIADMISIEKRKEYKARFDFNRPFNCIEMKYGKSIDILPKLPWSSRTITWLDYDGSLTEDVLQDIAFISTQAISGSMLIVTVNANQYRQPRDLPYPEVEQILIEKFKEQIGYEELPTTIRAVDLQGDENMARSCQKIIIDKVKEVVRDRNGLLSPATAMSFRLLFNFLYKDGAQMLTVGGIFSSADEADILRKCQFEKLEFVAKNESDFYEINVPVITPRERHYLTQRLPRGTNEEAKRIGLMSEEIANFARFYRYAPYFAEIELS